MESVTAIERAARIFTDSTAPAPGEVVEALLQAEKTTKRNKIRPNYEDLLGNWRLCFITGTKKSRDRAGIVLGSGRYLPGWIGITIAYKPTEIDDLEPIFAAGTVENCVKVGALQFTLSGPTKWRRDRNILAFDFTRVQVELFGATLYRGTMRGGEQKESQFYSDAIGKQAFFAYFYATKSAIAARGRGGGLAIWTREQ